MTDLDTLRPEVREALNRISRNFHISADTDTIRTELLRLAEDATMFAHAVSLGQRYKQRAETAEAELAALKARTIVSLEMVHEAEAHVPCAIHGPERWEWLAAFLTRALTHPDVPCPCCGVAPNGETYDHLTPEQWREMQPKEES